MSTALQLAVPGIVLVSAKYLLCTYRFGADHEAFTGYTMLYNTGERDYEGKRFLLKGTRVHDHMSDQLQLRAAVAQLPEEQLLKTKPLALATTLLSENDALSVEKLFMLAVMPSPTLKQTASDIFFKATEVRTEQFTKDVCIPPSSSSIAPA